jgi:hypothetical protein
MNIYIYTYIYIYIYICLYVFILQVESGEGQRDAGRGGRGPDPGDRDWGRGGSEHPNNYSTEKSNLHLHLVGRPDSRQDTHVLRGEDKNNCSCFHINQYIADIYLYTSTRISSYIYSYKYIHIYIYRCR